jgi:hypothetical protein
MLRWLFQLGDSVAQRRLRETASRRDLEDYLRRAPLLPGEDPSLVKGDLWRGDDDALGEEDMNNELHRAEAELDRRITALSGLKKGPLRTLVLHYMLNRRKYVAMNRFLAGQTTRTLALLRRYQAHTDLILRSINDQERYLREYLDKQVVQETRARGRQVLRNWVTKMRQTNAGLEDSIRDHLHRLDERLQAVVPPGSAPADRQGDAGDAGAKPSPAAPLEADDAATGVPDATGGEQAQPLPQAGGGWFDFLGSAGGLAGLAGFVPAQSAQEALSAAELQRQLVAEIDRAPLDAEERRLLAHRIRLADVDALLAREAGARGDSPIFFDPRLRATVRDLAAKYRLAFLEYVQAVLGAYVFVRQLRASLTDFFDGTQQEFARYEAGNVRLQERLQEVRRAMEGADADLRVTPGALEGIQRVFGRHLATIRAQIEASRRSIVRQVDDHERNGVRLTARADLPGLAPRSLASSASSALRGVARGLGLEAAPGEMPAVEVPGSLDELAGAGPGVFARAPVLDVLVRLVREAGAGKVAFADAGFPAALVDAALDVERQALRARPFAERVDYWRGTEPAFAALLAADAAGAGAGAMEGPVVRFCRKVEAMAQALYEKKRAELDAADQRRGEVEVGSTEGDALSKELAKLRATLKALPARRLALMERAVVAANRVIEVYLRTTGIGGLTDATSRARLDEALQALDALTASTPSLDDASDEVIERLRKAEDGLALMSVVRKQRAAVLQALTARGGEVACLFIDRAGDVDAAQANELAALVRTRFRCETAVLTELIGTSGFSNADLLTGALVAAAADAYALSAVNAGVASSDAPSVRLAMQKLVERLSTRVQGDEDERHRQHVCARLRVAQTLVATAVQRFQSPNRKIDGNKQKDLRRELLQDLFRPSDGDDADADDAAATS